jgi:hypothetical protein
MVALHVLVSGPSAFAPGSTRQRYTYIDRMSMELELKRFFQPDKQ